jgi:hypothetical protein
MPDNESGAESMIDNPQLTADLLAKLETALPLPAMVTSYLADALRKQSTEKLAIPKTCEVVKVFNVGDEGGIMCQLAITGQADDERVFLASITHLAFDPRHRLTRDIAGYQKRRIRKLRRLNG